jgi:tetratricopeptide (TPR) repeat protein
MLRTDSAALEERAARMRELLAREGSDEATGFGLGQTLLALGRAAEAADALQEAVRLSPSYTAAYRDLGRALLESSRLADARAALERGARVAEQTRDLQTGREIAVLPAAGRRAATTAAGARSRLRSAAGARALLPASTPPPAGFLRAPARPRGPAPARERPLRARDRPLRARHPGRSGPGTRLDRPLRRVAPSGRPRPRDRGGPAPRGARADDPLSHTNLSILYQGKGMIPEAEDEKAIAMRLQMRSRT